MTDITLTEVEHILRQAAVGIDKALAPVVAATAANMVDTQKQNIRVRTGRTRDSITATTPDGGALGPTSLEAFIGPRKPWAHTGRWIETGTVNQAPHVYIANSYDPHRTAHESAIMKATAEGTLRGLIP